MQKPENEEIWNLPFKDELFVYICQELSSFSERLMTVTQNYAFQKPTFICFLQSDTFEGFPAARGEEQKQEPP